MAIVDRDDVDWDRGGPTAGEASLLFAELQHRVANEIAAAVAAMRLAQSAGLDGPRVDLFDSAIQRLEGFGKVHGVLAMRPTQTIDIGAGLHRLCRGLVAGREGLDQTRIHLSVTMTTLPGGSGQRLLLIAGELVFNSIRHALSGRAGRLDISVYQIDDEVHLVIADDGHGIRKGAGSSGTGLGNGIVEELARMGGGRIECSTGSTGTAFHVTLPLIGRSPVDWIVPEVTA